MIVETGVSECFCSANFQEHYLLSVPLRFKNIAGHGDHCPLILAPSDSGAPHETLKKVVESDSPESYVLRKGRSWSRRNFLCVQESESELCLF